MSKIENSMRQFMFKNSLNEMVLDFIKTQTDLTDKDKKDCLEFVEFIIDKSVPSTEWNIRVHEEDGKNFDEFLEAQIKCIIEFIGLIITIFIENIKLKRIIEIENEQ